MYYLFAAFLDAPGWQFPMQGAGPECSRCVGCYVISFDQQLLLLRWPIIVQLTVSLQVTTSGSNSQLTVQEIEL